MVFMSDWLVHLVQVGRFGKHPNADSLSITQVYGQNVIFRTGGFQEGDLAVFLPPDSVLPMDPEHPLLKDNPGLKPGHRVDAVRLRGIFSNGFMVPAKILFTEEELKDIPVGTHVADRIGVTKYEDEGDRLSTRGDNERDPGYMPCYTDIEGWPKHRYVIPEGEEVVLTEKIHGANARFCFRDGRLWVGSRTGVKAQYVRPDGTEGNLWWNVAKNMDLENKFKTLQLEPTVENVPTWDLVLFGEVYGQVQDLKYGVNTGATFRLFDVYSPSLGRYVDWDLTVQVAKIMGLELVPELYRGPWKTELEDLRNGSSVLYPGHIREGYVIKPVRERFAQYNPENRHSFTGRVIFKFVGEDYKTRKRK
jgi:RNA ligase (TIGR02306 family)